MTTTPNLAQLDTLLACECIADIDLYDINESYLIELSRYFSVEINEIPPGKYIVVSNDNVQLSLHAFKK